VADRRRKIFDVCAIGTGDGGGAMIDELTHAGMSVVALERGPRLGPAEFMGHDELTNIILATGMVCSMSRKGNCWDNAPTESFFNSLKNERVHGTRYSTWADAEADLFDYIEPFYNPRRKHSTLGYASPMKFLDDWISTQHEQQLAE